ncbi:MAG: hypothetical protein EZS28_050240, partial [Streblomastix strix]
MVNCYE